MDATILLVEDDPSIRVVAALALGADPRLILTVRGAGYKAARPG